MSSLGENTKNAIRRVVEALPFLKADGTGIPTSQRPVIEAIRRKASERAGGTRDVQVEAAEAWATVEIEKALEADNTAGKADAPQESGGALGLGVPPVESKPVEPTASVVHGGVALNPPDANGAEQKEGA